MRYFVLLVSYLLMLAHTVVPHHHHVANTNTDHSITDHHHGVHQHDHFANRHATENSTNETESESPFSHIISPVDGTIYLSHQSGISIEQRVHVDISAIIPASNYLLVIHNQTNKFNFQRVERIYRDPLSPNSGLRAPPIC